MFRLFLILIAIVVVVSMAVAIGDDDQTPIYQPQEEPPVLTTDFGKTGVESSRIIKLDNNNSPTVRPITVAIIDTGIKASPYVKNKVVVSKSFTGRDCETDLVGHGTYMAQFYNLSKVELICVQVIQSDDAYHHSGAGMSGWGTLSALLEGLAYVATLDVDIVNLSLVGYPETPELVAAISKLQERAVVVMAAGNNNGGVTSPCRIAFTVLRSAICVAGANMDGSMWKMSNWGKDADIANFGPATSWAAAETGFVVSWLMGLLPPDAPRPLPALFKKLIILGADYKSSLVGLVGDPDRGLDARLTSLSGARLVLERLQSLKLISYSPTRVVVGNDVTVTTNEDPVWLGNFFPAFDPVAVPKFRLYDGGGNTTIVDGKFYNRELQFRAPIQGDFTVQLIVEGLPVGDKLPIRIYP